MAHSAATVLTDTATYRLEKSVFDKPIIAALRDLGKPFALFRLPYADTAHLMVADKVENPTDLPLSTQALTGFLVAPFLFKPGNAVFIPAQYHATIYLSAGVTTYHGESSKAFFSRLKEKHSFENLSESSVSRYELEQTIAQSNAVFERLVQLGISKIKEGAMQKVVLSRRVDVPTLCMPDLELLFTQACAEHANALVAICNLPEKGCWITITPEYLLHATPRTVKTMALAGTKKSKPGEEPVDVLWTQKEIEEQALVSRYIIEAFKRIRLREYADIGPQTVKAGDLWHLMTEFYIDKSKVDLDDIEAAIVQLLHPTAAVCGFPKQPALDFINQHEGYDRELYSGFLGPVNLEEETHLFVHLRCAKLHASGSMVSLYAGAGVVKDSIPEKEVTETFNKMRTVGRYFGI